MASMYSLVVNRFDVAIMEGAIARQLMDELVKWLIEMYSNLLGGAGREYWTTMVLKKWSYLKIG